MGVVDIACRPTVQVIGAYLHSRLGTRRAASHVPTSAPAAAENTYYGARVASGPDLTCGVDDAFALALDPSVRDFAARRSPAVPVCFVAKGRGVARTQGERTRERQAGRQAGQGAALRAPPPPQVFSLPPRRWSYHQRKRIGTGRAPDTWRAAVPVTKEDYACSAPRTFGFNSLCCWLFFTSDRVVVASMCLPIHPSIHTNGSDDSEYVR